MKLSLCRYLAGVMIMMGMAAGGALGQDAQRAVTAPKLDTNHTAVSLTFPEIESVSCTQGGGGPWQNLSYLYADKDGNVIHQIVHPDRESKAGFIEERIVSRNHSEIFSNVVAGLRPQELITYAKERKYGIVDEPIITYEVTFANGSKIEASRWSQEKIPALIELTDRIKKAVSAVQALQPPEKRPFKFEQNQFGQSWNILHESKVAKPEGKEK